MTLAPTVHASCVLVGAAGILIRGASGAGKSRLALELMEDARARGQFAALVADDRVHLEAASGRLVAHAPAAIAGRIEARGLGIVAVRHVRSAVVRLVVDLTATPDRMPAPEAAVADVEGVRLPALAVDGAAARRLAPLVLAGAGVFR